MTESEKKIAVQTAKMGRQIPIIAGEPFMTMKEQIEPKSKILMGYWWLQGPLIPSEVDPNLQPLPGCDFKWFTPLDVDNPNPDDVLEMIQEGLVEIRANSLIPQKATVVLTYKGVMEMLKTK